MNDYAFGNLLVGGTEIQCPVMIIDPKYTTPMYEMLLHTYATLSRRVREHDDLELRMLTGACPQYHPLCRQQPTGEKYFQGLYKGKTRRRCSAARLCWLVAATQSGLGLLPV